MQAEAVKLESKTGTKWSQPYMHELSFYASTVLMYADIQKYPSHIPFYRLLFFLITACMYFFFLQRSTFKDFYTINIWITLE